MKCMKSRKCHLKHARESGNTVKVDYTVLDMQKHGTATALSLHNPNINPKYPESYPNILNND